MEQTSANEVPPVVQVAFKFVELCNAQMGPRPFMVGNSPSQQEFQVKDVDLHPTQEGCFKTALACLGRYFGGYASGEGQREGAPAQHFPASAEA